MYVCDRLCVRHAEIVDEPCLHVCCVVMVMCICVTGFVFSMQCVDEPCLHVCCHGDVYVCVTGFVFAMLRLWTNPVHMCGVMVMCMCV